MPARYKSSRQLLRYPRFMTIGYLLVAVGLAQLVVGGTISVVALAGVGALWVLVGIVNIVLSRQQPATGAAYDRQSPISQARALQPTRGSNLRTVGLLLCAVAAIAVGLGSTELAEAGSWQLFPMMAGGAVGLLVMMVALFLVGNGKSRLATRDATVEIVRADPTVPHTTTRTGKYFTIEVEVSVDGFPAYETTIQELVPFLAVDQLIAGSHFAALAAGAAKPKAVVVDWREPIKVAAVRPVDESASSSTDIELHGN